jgi:SRSO17 transposase
MGLPTRLGVSSRASRLRRSLALALWRGADTTTFARLDEEGRLTRPLEWFLIEWPEREKEPTRCWLSTLPEDTPIAILLDTAKLRRRIERDYEELKSELGLARFDGRSWRYHLAPLCIAA